VIRDILNTVLVTGPIIVGVAILWQIRCRHDDE
jgi:hypothetical protein